MKSLHLFLKWYFKQDSVYTVLGLGLCTNIPIFRKYCGKLIEAILSKFALCSHKKLLAEFLARDFPHGTFVRDQNIKETNFSLRICERKVMYAEGNQLLLRILKKIQMATF